MNGLETQVAVLDSKIDTLIDGVKELKDEVANGHERVHAVELKQVALEEQLSSTRKMLIVLNSVTSAIAGSVPALIAWLKS